MTDPAYRFAPIPDHPGYYVSADGKVWSTKQKVKVAGRKAGWYWQPFGENPRELKAQPHKLGYRMVGISTPEYRLRSVHRLVLEAFVGPCPAGMQTRHLDGNKANNSLDNLQWGTHKENHEDIIRHGRSTRARVPSAKLTPDQVREIRKFAQSGLSQEKIGRRFGVTQTAISLIIRRKNWASLED